MSDSLYELSKDLAIINNEIADAQGELNETLEAQLDAVSLAINDKVQSIGKWTINIDGKVEAIDNEIIRLQHKKCMAENLNKRLQDYIKQSMERADIHKLEFPTFTIAIHNNPPSVEIINEEIVPNAYKTIKQTISIDKKRIMDDLKTGIKVEGCSLVSDKTHLKIR